MNLTKPKIFSNSPDSNRGGAGGNVSDEVAANISSAMEVGRKHLKALPDRKMIIGENGEDLCFVGRSGFKIIDKVHSRRDVMNSLARELTLLIKTRDSTLLANDRSIKNLEIFLLMCASYKEKRDILKQMKETYAEFIFLIENSHMDEKLEETAQEFYESFIRDMGFGGKNLDVILQFSWAHDEGRGMQKFPYCCHCWMIITCIIGMMKFEEDEIDEE